MLLLDVRLTYTFYYRNNDFKHLKPQFKLNDPYTKDFLHQLQDKKVILSHLSTNQLTVTGQIMAVPFKESTFTVVSILYTIDDFASYTKLPAKSVPNVCIGCFHKFDTYSFKVKVKDDTPSLKFFIIYRANGEEYYDNNNEQMYSVINPNYEDDDTIFFSAKPEP